MIACQTPNKNSAAALRVPANRIGTIFRGTRGITVDTAMRLSRTFNTTAEFWLNLQTTHDLTKAQGRCDPRYLAVIGGTMSAIAGAAPFADAIRELRDARRQPMAYAAVVKRTYLMRSVMEERIPTKA